MSGARTALRRLRQEPQELAAVCKGYGVLVLTAFGSAISERAEPRDLDLGVLFEPRTRPDLLGLRDSLVAACGYEDIDLVMLDGAGPVIRERALVGSELLDEAHKSAHVNASIAATMERMDTAWLREMALARLAR